MQLGARDPAYSVTPAEILSRLVEMLPTEGGWTAGSGWEMGVPWGAV